MADFWIKIEKSTPDKPEVLQISSLLNIPDPDTVMGKLVRVWSWFDSNSENGHAPSVTNVLLDRMTGVTGFTDALVEVGWMDKTEEGFYMSNFDRHIGKGAKKRASDAERKRKSRECHTSSVTKKGLDKSRVDKSRVDNKDKRKRFSPPTEQEVTDFMISLNWPNDNGATARAMIDYYAQQGWKLSNGNMMKDWNAAARGWLRNQQKWDAKK
tara:strand:- start:7119 stop:7754 length:636 start_codon:yes stop_codon:yes gene_type:complete